MAIFPFDNPEWSSLSWSLPLTEEEWGFPDDVALGLLLDFTPTRIAELSVLPVADLNLSARPNNALSTSGVTTLGQLIMQPLASILALPNMGRGSLLEVVDALWCFDPANLDPVTGGKSSYLPKRRLCAADFYQFIDADDLEPLSIQREWQLFSGKASCSDALSVLALDLPEEQHQRLYGCGITSISDLLKLTWTQLDESVGTDAATDILLSLTTLASEIGTQRSAEAEQKAVEQESAEQKAGAKCNQATILAERFKEVLVTEIDFVFEETLHVLHRANFQTISDLLKALDPLHPELYLDLYAFMDVWTQFRHLGLVEGDRLAERKRRSERTQAATSLDNVLTAWRESVKPHAWKLLNARWRLETGEGEDISEEVSSGQEPTLMELGAEIGVTQERARQILLTTVKRLSKSQDNYFPAIVNLLRFCLYHTGGVVSLTKAAELMSDLITPGKVRPVSLCRFVFDHSDAFVAVKRNAVYALPYAPIAHYDPIIRQGYAIQKQSQEMLGLEALAEGVATTLFPLTGDAETDKKLPSREFVLACLRADGGLEDQHNLPTEALLVRVLRQLGSPRHFTEITAFLNETGWRRKAASSDYIHGRLVYGRDLFVHVSRGTYGLAEWGLEDQRTERSGVQIPDLIIELLEQRGVPVPRDEIVAHVLSQKKCRDYSVLHRLFYDKRFTEFSKHTYGLAKWTF